MTTATSNNLESIVVHSEADCLVLDELKQLPAEMAGQMAYHLLNGKGRSRISLMGDSSIGKSTVQKATESCLRVL